MGSTFLKLGKIGFLNKIKWYKNWEISKPRKEGLQRKLKCQRDCSGNLKNYKD